MNIEVQGNSSLPAGVGEQKINDQTSDLRDVTLNVRCDFNHKSIAQKTGQCEAWVKGMLIDRQGQLANSNMTVLGLHTVVQSGKAYVCTPQTGLVETTHTSQIINLEDEVLRREHDRVPKHVTVTAEWDKNKAFDGGQGNVLGDNVLFKVKNNQQKVEIPIVEAENECLLYYGAILVNAHMIISFPNEQYPIWKMVWGENYVDGFIMTDAGKGFYLEWHTDRPHWHQPITVDSDGYYILGKRLEGEVDREAYHLTGFRIPYGKAVYSKQGVIHCDAALTGKNWLVGFTDSRHFSTALVRNEAMELVNLKGKMNA